MAPLKRCWDLTDAHIAEAVETRAGMGELLRELGSIARPNDGGPKMLIAIARLASPACDWLEGGIRVELESVETRTRIAIMEDLGGVRELVFPRLLVDVPLAELERSLRIAPRAVEPLELQQRTHAADKLVLAQKRRRPSRLPPSFELADDCIRPATVPPPPRPAEGKPAAARKGPPPLPRERPRSRPPPASSKEPLLEIPRTSKVLDFGDFDTAAAKVKAAAAATAKKPSSPPPRR